MASPKNKRWSEIGFQRRTRSQRAPEDQTFRRMFEGHSAIMLLIDPQTDVILDANQAAVDFYGVPKSKLCGLSIQEINALPPEQVAVELQKAFNEQRHYFIFRHRLANGEERIVEVHSTPIALRKKQILFSIIHDITARKLADEALREAEWKFMALFELGPIGVAYHRMIYDDLGKPIDYYFIDANTKYIELTGVNPIGKTVIQAFPGIEHDPFDWIGTFGHVAQTGEPVRFEQYLQSNNRWYDCVGYQYKPGHFVAAFFEITARKQAETALRENEAMLKKVQAVAHMGSWEIDLTTKTVIASDEAHHVYGIAQGPMTLAYVQSVPLPEFRPILDAALTALITEGKRYDVEFKIQRLSDSEIRDIHSLAEYSTSSRTIIGSVQDITERKRAEESIRQRVMELETINRISLAVRGVSKQEEMLDIVLDEALAILNTPHGSIELYNKTTGKLEKAITRGWTAQIIEPPQNNSEGIAGKVFTTGEIYISREFASDPETRAASRSQIPPHWGGACLPIRTTQKTLGVLIVCVPVERKLDQDEIRLLSILSEMAGAALQRMQLHEQTVHRLEHLQALRAVDQAISSSHDLRLTLNILLTQTISQLEVDAADVLLLQPGSNGLELAAGRGFHTLLLESINLGDSFAARAILEQRSILTLDVESAMLRENPQFGKLWQEESFACYWCVPLIVKGEVKGALEVYCRTAFTPDEEWLEFLEALAGQAAIAINSTQLFENLQRANLDLSRAYDATIEGWSRAMDLRDHETEGHTLRVTDLTVKLARAMQVSESQLTVLRRGTLLHDIGKMGIPDSILLKEGPLTDAEWAIMRNHPQLAHDMLTPIAYLNDALDIPYGHHEKWDGTGYPQGLQGDKIPLLARIFAIVDVWDALTSDRPYRKKWTKQKTLQYIKEQSGKHFDPQVVNVFLKVTDILT